eukprot:gene3603-biopygen5299
MRCCCKALKELVADDTFWRDLAEAKWGPAVLELKPLAVSSDKIMSWQSYCCKRMCLKSTRQSPLQLVQEQYTDPWQHIVACTLCSRTSGSGIIRQVISSFFQVFPTPTAVLTADPADIVSVIHPLGLQPSRLAAVRSVSRGFLSTDWMSPAEFHGCGKFVTDSWMIFCRGQRDTKHVDDCKLKQYLAWANKQQTVAADGAMCTKGWERPAKQGKKHQDDMQQRQQNSSVFVKQKAAPGASGGCQLQANRDKGVTTRAAAAAAALKAPCQQGNFDGAALRRARRAAAT